MESWSVHHLFEEAKTQHSREVAFDLQRYALNLNNKGLPVIFTLGHLGKITKTHYNFLHESVSRQREYSNYRMFSIGKRSGGRRVIHAVGGKLMVVQQFINSEILQKIKPHFSTYAFHPSGGIRKCARVHCGAKWLIQFDLSDFFFSIPESSVYNIFKQLGYKSLLAFEMARLCTTNKLPSGVSRNFSRTQNLYHVENEEGLPYNLSPYDCMGVLPQGAPTSPMLSNLAAIKLDQTLHAFANKNGFVYTRYADDLTFSTRQLPSNMSIGKIKNKIIWLIRESGFKENPKKFRVAGPGSKKMVLGLLVDGDYPRISKEMYKRIDRYLYASEKYGLAETAVHEEFDSGYGFYNHLSGLIAYVKDVDRKRWELFNQKFNAIPSPAEAT